MFLRRQIIVFVKFFVNGIAVLLNYTDLMREYYLLCGPDYFCLPSDKTHQWNISPNLSYRHLYICPECQCDYACITRGDCCADMYFSFPELKCVNRTIINGRYDKDKTEQYSALMVTSCPEGSNKELKEKCVSLNDTKSRLRNFPVTGLQPPLTFYNKFCAECHNVVNYTFWSLDIDCYLFADLNFLSTIDELVDESFKRECILQAFREVELKEKNCFDIDERQSLFTKCNQTGEWLIDNPNIAYACSSFYKGKYRLFKNVFCYMCNPSSQNLITITFTTCNATGQWKTYDSGLQQACKDLPETLTTLPFKNIFCYLCNRGNDSSQLFVDIKGQLKELPIYDTHYHYQYNMDITDFNLEFFTYTLHEKMKKEKAMGDLLHIPFEASSFRIEDGTLINMTNLLLQRASLTRKVQVCKSRYFVFPEGYSSSCTCNISCLFDYEMNNCCEDLSLQVPMRCRNILLYNPSPYSRKKGFPTINGCFQETTKQIIKIGCSFPKPGDIYSEIPLTKVNGIVYDNFYCVLCNFDSNQFIRKMQGQSSDLKFIQRSSDDFFYIDKYLTSKYQFTIWNLLMVCPKYLDHSHYLTLGDLLEIAKQLKCRIQFRKEISELRSCSLPREVNMMRCADQSNWTYTDQDVEWACNNIVNYKPYSTIALHRNLPKKVDSSEQKHYRHLSGFSNQFCALCKPKQTFPEYFIDNCTISAGSDDCLYYPRIYFYYPFKNIHCVTCNNIGISGVRGEDGDADLDTYNRIVGINWFPILRNLFSISGDGAIEDATAIGRCKNNQAYDQYQDLCRNITCYSGKYLEGSWCIPLFERTMNLQYSMSLTTKLYSLTEPSSNLSFSSHEEDIREELKTYFISNLDVQPDVKIITLNEHDRGCGGNHTYCITIKLKIFFRSSVPRILVERSLINFKVRTEKRSYRHIRWSNDKTEHGLKKTMEMKKRFVAEPFFFGYYSAKVSNILICPQIELDYDEYNVSDDNSVLTLTRDGFDIVAFDEFAMTPSGKIRVCLDYLQRINYLPIQHAAETVAVDLKQKYLWIISLISSIISIFSLVLGLIAYYLFPSLRTIPGKLIILMMTSLLFTLVFLQISYIAVQFKNGCIAVAVVLHFSWLTVFTCTQTANFHMWRTFTTKETPSYKSSRIFPKYLICIFGLPSCLVLVHIALSWLIHSDSFGGYGGSKCFIKNKYFLIALFICPVALICLVNILFFSLTAHAIRSTPTIASNQRKRNELVIFARLASITGLSWLLQIIDSFLPFTYFTFLSTIVNSLQGLFIFIAFIVNKRVWDLLRNKFCSANGTNGSVT